MPSKGSSKAAISDMVRAIILFLFFTVYNFTGYSQSTLEIRVNQPGTLSEKLPERDDSYVTQLKIIGNLNDQDFNYLRTWGWYDPNDICKKLYDLDLSETIVDEIPSSAFAGSGLRKVKLPKTVKTIYDYAFATNNLIDIDLSLCSNLTSVRAWAFNNCSRLGVIDFSECISLDEIISEAFANCNQLKILIFPPNIKDIRFQIPTSSNLEYIEIPSSIENIYFYGNNNQRFSPQVKIKSSTPPSYSTNSDNISPVIYVPSGTESNYFSKWGRGVKGYDQSKITNVKLKYNEGGIVKVRNKIYQSGENISVEDGNLFYAYVEPNIGYHIKNISNMASRGGGIYLFGNLYENSESTITFEEDDLVPFKINYSDGGIVKINDNLINAGTSVKIEPLKDVKVYITPDEGYHLMNVRLDNTDVTNQVKDGILTILSKFSNKELSVSFEKDPPVTYTVKVSCLSNSLWGDVIVNDTQIIDQETFTVEALTDLSISIIPKQINNGYLKEVKIGTTDVTDQVKDNLLTIHSISEDKEVTVSFGQNYNVIARYSEGGTIKINGNIVKNSSATVISPSTNVLISIIPNEGYHIKLFELGPHWDKREDVTNQIEEGNFIIHSISENKIMNVIFEKDDLITYSVKVSYSGEGIVKVNNKEITNNTSINIFEESIDVQISIIPNKGYHLKQVTVGNTDMTEKVKENLLLLPAISENKDIKITFEKDIPTNYTFKVYYSGVGSVKMNDKICRNGESITVPTTDVKFLFIPEEGYYLKEVQLGTTNITDQIVNNSYIIPTVSSNTSISVTFEKIPTYKLNISISGGGSIKIGDKVITQSTYISDIKKGNSILIDFLSSKYYVIKSVTIGDQDITNQIKDDVYEIKSIMSDLTLKIEYIRKQYTLSVNIQGADKIQINGEDITNESSITANSGYNRIDISSEYYLIKQVLLDNEIIKKGPSGYIEISMDSDKKLTIIAELREKREVSLTSEEPGTLASHLSEEDMKMVTDLNISGEIDQRDFLVLNQMQSLYKLNLIVTIREYNNYPANTIPENAFHNNKTIKMIDLSNSIEAIGKQAFWGSAISHIKKYDENLTKIGEEAFKDCQYLITIPSTYNVPVIEKSTFENCSSLSALPSLYNLIEVKESAFRNCKNLSVDLGSFLERIGNYAFENVKEINTLPVFQGEAKLSYIGTDAFKGTQSNRFDFSNYPYLQELPNFEGSSNLNHITFPPNVKEVPANTFKGCTSLQEVYMNNKIERIAENAFCDSNGISYLYVPVNNTPEIFTNSFSEFCYINAALIVPTDYMYFYRHHAVWSKFTEIKHLGNDSHRQISATISEGGHVLSKAEEDMYPNNTFDTGSYNSISYPTSSRVEFIVEIDKGYSIESIILNGEDITNTLDNNNEFIIPNLMVDSHLEVKFKKEEDPTGTETIHINKHIYLSGSNQLVFSDFKIGTHAIVFDASGRMIKQITIRNNMERIDLPGRGIYFVRVENKSTKIIL